MKQHSAAQLKALEGAAQSMYRALLTMRTPAEVRQFLLDLCTPAELEAMYRFSIRIFAERTAMEHAGRIFTSTRQERFEQYGHPAYNGAADPAEDEIGRAHV